MKTRNLGKDGPEVSALSFGSRAAASDPKNREANKKQAIETLRYGIDSGITFLNTADFYEAGTNELIIGEAIKERREKVFLSVKTGVLWDPNHRYLGMDMRPKAIKNFCAYSLTRLGVDTIDLYQPARVDPDVPIEETVGAIKDLIQEGKVRYLGLSEATSEQLRRAHKVHPVTALEIEYSLATRFIEKGILPTARELGVGIVPYSVLSYGLLTGRLTDPPPPDDYTSRFPRFQGENFKHNLAKVERLKEMAARKGVSASQLAVAWALHQGEDIVPIVGMSKPARVEENLKALAIELTRKELDELDEEFKEGSIKGDRYPEALKAIVPS